MNSKSVRIVGAGLIGTSIGLALKAAGASVQFADIDANNLGKVWPVCPYVVTYMKRHPETAHLLSRELN